MPVHLKAFIVVMVLSVPMLLLVQRFACDVAIAPEDYRRRAIVWAVATVMLFLPANYWILAPVVLPLIAVAGGKDSSRMGLYLFLLFVIPAFPSGLRELSGIGNLLLEMNHFRWLAVLLLLPLYLALRRRPEIQPFGSTTLDKLVVAYLLLHLAVELSNTTLTNAARNMIEIWLDVFLPYYVASRALRSIAAYRDALFSFVVAVLLMCPVSAFEVYGNWLLYSGLDHLTGAGHWGLGYDLERGGILRAQVTTGQPIVLGYVAVVAIGLLPFLRSAFVKTHWWWFTCAMLGVGLLAALSRGPWVGGAGALLVMLMTGPRVSEKIGKAVLFSLIALPLLLMTPYGQRALDYLPFIGTVEAQNVEFRQRLLTVSLGVLENYPLFGTWGSGYHPDLEQMRGNDGLIDIVNSYIGVALTTGAVGLAVFCAPMVVVGISIARAMSEQRDKDCDLHRLGRALLASLVAIGITIATVSSIAAVPLVLWIVVGLGAGYVGLAHAEAKASRRPDMASAADRPRGATGSAPASAAWWGARR